MADDLIYANGVNGLTGEYLLPPLEPSEVAVRAKQPPDDPDLAAQLRQVWEAISEPSYGLPFNVHPEDVGEAGWAVIFSADEGEDVRAALAPLIEHRGRQAGDARTRVLEYRPDERWSDWLARHGTAPGTVDPDRVPYYVLIVGAPERIPFSFQYLLDVEYAVGRLDFEDAAGYERYVAALLDYERSDAAPHDTTAVFFGTRHRSDGATELSANSLLTPLAESFQPGGRFANAIPGYRIDSMVGEPATKSALDETLSGVSAAGRPALLFTATHGMGGWPPGHADQEARHGALLCQDWPGIGRISAQQYFAAADLEPDARVHGLVAFFFACYSAGTPLLDESTHKPGELPLAIAAKPFVAQLPKALLSHPQGGALVVIGHIERAWGYSFVSGRQEQLLPFQNAIGQILLGRPVGHAMNDFNERYAALSVNISDVLRSIGFGGKVVPDAQLASLWTERSDAQNYIVLGDPAAALKPP